ncbi:MAG: hypothetical protein LGB54_07550 [Sulfurovum sp.]|nr:hypothetical protein [Sulfurovum sp.]
MKKKTEFDEERLTQLKQTFNNPSKFWETIRPVNRKSTIYNPSRVNSGTNTSLEFLIRLTLSLKKRITTMLWRMKQQQVYSMNLSPEMRSQPVYVILSLEKAQVLIKLSEMLKYVDQNVAGFLVQLFNKLCDEGIFPKEWSKSITVPILKKGDANILDNYRGIALTSVLSKVYTHILNKRLTGWEEQEEKILEQQAGFRTGYSTMDHIFTLYRLVQIFYVTFVDL